MISLSTIAKDVATSDAGKAFGWKKLPKDANLRSKIEILGENALKLSHWIPVVGTVTGLLSLGLVVNNISNKKRLDDEDTSKITRSILAIVNLPFILIFLDFAATYLRKNEMPLSDLANLLNQLDEKNKQRAPKAKQEVEKMEDAKPASQNTTQPTQGSLKKQQWIKTDSVELKALHETHPRTNTNSVKPTSPYDAIEDLDPWKN